MTELSWRELAGRLRPARSYWLATTAHDGSPHVAPVWGVVVDDTLFLYSERRTVKAANIARDARVALHLPDADDVLIVYGTLDDLGVPQGHPQVMAALDAKYSTAQDRPYLPSGDPAFDVLWALNASRALLWRLADWDGSHRRWNAERSGIHGQGGAVLTRERRTEGSGGDGHAAEHGPGQVTRRSGPSAGLL